jgi:hypothetical protein
MSSAKLDHVERYAGLHGYSFSVLMIRMFVDCLNLGQEMEFLRRNPQKGCRDSARVEGYVRRGNLISGGISSKYDFIAPHYNFFAEIRHPGFQER